MNTYRVMVVEDSKPILRDIVAQIQQASGRVEVVVTASNGNDALNKLRDATVDIIFSDIKMPVMSGLDFLAKARQLKRASRFVIVSGYDDFDFARRAIQLRVDDYILKPVVGKKLQELLGRIVASLDQDRIDLFQGELSASLKQGRTLFHPPNDLLGTAYALCLVRSGPLRDGPFAPNRIEVAADFREALRCEPNIIVAETRHYSEHAVLVDQAQVSREAWKGACTEVYERIVRARRAARMACSSGHDNVTELPAHISFLSGCLEAHVFLEEPTFVWADGMTPDANSRLPHQELLRFREEARFIAGTRSSENFRRHAEAIVRSWRDQHLPVVAIRELLGSMVEALNEIANGVSVDAIPVMSADEILSSSITYEEVVDQLCRAHELIADRKIKGRPSTEVIAAATIKFFQDNIFRDISMNDVAAQLGVSPSYIHRVLRSELGTAPMEYYHALKIEHAKRIMDHYPDVRVKDIAESLGFQDEHYFSRVFKTHVSMSPLEYRRRVKNSGT